MLFSWEVPTNSLLKLVETQDILFCNINTALCDPAYLRFFQERAGKSYVILDNGSYEKGVPVSDSTLVMVAQQIGAKEIIAPDIPKNSTLTLQRVNAFFRYLESQELLNDFQVMIVPQGKTEDEIYNSFLKLIKFPTKLFGIPYSNLPSTNPYRCEQLRFSLIKRMANSGLLQTRYIHLLGLAALQYVKAYRKGKYFFRIRSLNTSYPTALAVSGKLCTQTKHKYTFHDSPALTLSQHTLDLIKKNTGFIKNYI